jgi:hypothetical protein
MLGGIILIPGACSIMVGGIILIPGSMLDHGRRYHFDLLRGPIAAPACQDELRSSRTHGGAPRALGRTIS